jgi:hypothetical protein
MGKRANMALALAIPGSVAFLLVVLAARPVTRFPKALPPLKEEDLRSRLR